MEPSIIHNPAALHEMTLIYKRDIEAARTKSGDDEKERKIYKIKRKKKGVPIIMWLWHPSIKHRMNFFILLFLFLFLE